MLCADVVQAHIVPRSVADVVADATAAGCSKGSPATPYGWALHRQTLLLWKIEDALQAMVRRLQLPEAPSGRCFVEVVPHSHSTAVTVLLCTGSGQLYVWLDANFPAAPFSRRLFINANSGTNEDAVICALAASAADTGSSLGFLAVVATADAALHLYHGSQNGIFPRQFHTAATAAGPKPGMFGALGNVVKALYSEAFDPLHNVQRSGASAMAALQLQLLPLDGSRWKLLVLTPEALDCWLLGSLAGQQSSEQLLWSYNLYGVLSDSLQAREITALAFAVSAASHSQPAAAAVPATTSRAPGRQAAQARKQMVYVWSTHAAVNSITQVHALTTLTLEEGSVVPTYLHSMQLAPNVPLPQPQRLAAIRSNWQMLPHSSYSSCLLLAPNGTLLEWIPSAGAPHALGSSPDNIAISCSAPTDCNSAADNWQLLNASYGVLEFLARDPQAVGSEGVPVTGAMTAEQEATALELIFKTVELMAKEYAAGCPYKELAEGLGDRLARLAVFATGQRGFDLLVAASRDLVDTMAKAGSSGSSSGSLRALLSDKQIRHDLLLSAYQSGGVLQQLPPQHAHAIFQHSEMLAAVGNVLQWQRQLEAAAAAGDAKTGVTTTQAAAAASAVESAGVLAAEGAGSTDHSNSASLSQQWEVFFGRPSASMPALFNVVGAQAAAVKQELGRDDRRGSALHALQQLLGLCGLLQAAVTGAQDKTAELAQHMAEQLTQAVAAGPSWLAGEAARNAWMQIAEACMQLHSSLLEPSQQLQLARGAHLPALQQLLAGMRETIVCSSNPSLHLKEDYARLPKEHGAVLLKVARDELDTLRSVGALAAASEASAGGGVSPGDANIIAAVEHALVWPLEALAQQHRCHVLLYDACELLLTTGLLDSGRLQQHMHQEVTDSRGVLPVDSFTFYVMERWRSSSQLSSLLQLGRSGFQQQLQQFLAGYPALLWMSEVQANMVAKAAGSLAAAADAEQHSVIKCHRLLCLSKLAARAAGVDAKQSQLQLKASARLRQLALQQELGVRDQGPLSTAQLAQAALAVAEAGQGREAAAAAVAAVEALALMPDTQQNEQYWHLWDKSWLAVLQHTPLQELAAARATSRAAGGQLEQYEAGLKDCPLYLAVQRAAAALADACQVQGGTSPAEVLDLTGSKLAARVQQQQPDVADCLHDLLSTAASSAQPILTSA